MTTPYTHVLDLAKEAQPPEKGMNYDAARAPKVAAE